MAILTFNDTDYLALDTAPTGTAGGPTPSAAATARINPESVYPPPLPQPEPARNSGSSNERRLPASFLSNLRPLLARFPLVHVSVTPDPLPREARIARLRDMRRTASPEFAPSLAGLADFYGRGGTLPSGDVHVLSAGDMVFHGTAVDLKYFLGVWLRSADEETVRGRYPVVDVGFAFLI